MNFWKSFLRWRWYEYIIVGIIIGICLGYYIGVYNYEWRVSEHLTPRECAEIVCESHNYTNSGTIGTEDGTYRDLSIIGCYNEIWCEDCGWDGEGLSVYDENSSTIIRCELKNETVCN